MLKRQLCCCIMEIFMHAHVWPITCIVLMFGGDGLCAQSFLLFCIAFFLYCYSFLRTNKEIFVFISLSDWKLCSPWYATVCTDLSIHVYKDSVTAEAQTSSGINISEKKLCAWSFMTRVSMIEQLPLVWYVGSMWQCLGNQCLTPVDYAYNKRSM